MLITAIESVVVSLPFEMGGPHPLFAGQPWDHLDILVVKVETEDGLVGWGEAVGHTAIPATKAALDTIVAPLLIGRDAGDINALTRAVLHGTHLLGRNGPFVYAFSGVEIALWDLLGKRAGQPLWRLLGGGRSGDLPAYASLPRYGDNALVARNTAAAYGTNDLETKPRRCTRAFGTHRAFSSETRSIQATALAEAVTVGSPVVLLLTKLNARGPRRQRRQYPTKQE